MAAINRADDLLARSRPPLAVARKAKDRASPPGRRALVWGLAVAAPAGAVALVVSRMTGPNASPSDDVLAKGGGALPPALEIHARRGAALFQVTGDARVRPGDTIRFVVHRPEGLTHVMIVSVDGVGAATLCFPYGGRQSAEIAGVRARAELPGAIVLDASPGPERVFALFSRAPLAWPDAEQALLALGRGGAAAVRREKVLPVTAQAQATVLLEKEEAP